MRAPYHADTPCRGAGIAADHNVVFQECFGQWSTELRGMCATLISVAAPRCATYEDLCAVPDTKVAELIDGELFVSPRPAAACVGGVGHWCGPIRRIRAAPRSQRASRRIVDPLRTRAALRQGRARARPSGVAPRTPARDAQHRRLHAGPGLGARSRLAINRSARSRAQDAGVRARRRAASLVGRPAPTHARSLSALSPELSWPDSLDSG